MTRDGGKSAVERLRAIDTTNNEFKRQLLDWAINLDIRIREAFKRDAHISARLNAMPPLAELRNLLTAGKTPQA